VNPRKSKIGLSVMAVLFLCYLCAARVVVVRAVLPPHVGGAQIVRSFLRPPYQMATPHRNLLKEARFSIFPVTSVCASGTNPPCDATTEQATCNTVCGFCGHCPDCVNGPCTIYTCQQTTNVRSLCVLRQGTGSCAGCEQDHNVACSRPGP
jgi:hypothetical protein